MDVKAQFCKRLYEEMQEFRSSENNLGKNPVKEQLISLLYNVLIQSADDFSEVLLTNLVNESANILETLYENLKEHSAMDEEMDSDFEDDSEEEMDNLLNLYRKMERDEAYL